MKKCGTIALIGPSNAGKSTLLNTILGTKVAIVSHKIQTTRTCLAGIHMHGDTQMIFLDTPGIFKPKKTLERRMVSSAWSSLEGANVVLLMVDAARSFEDGEIQQLLTRLKKMEKRVDLLLNKVDLVKKEDLLPKAQAYMDTGIVENIFMISAKKDQGLEDLMHHLDQHMPEGEWQYPEDQLTDVSSKSLAAEITRERLMHHVHAEIPYELTVLPEVWEPLPKEGVKIIQTILVKEEGHRPIILGKGGIRLKTIGTEARRHMEDLFGHKVHLLLHIKADKRWQERQENYLDS